MLAVVVVPQCMWLCAVGLMKRRKNIARTQCQQSSRTTAGRPEALRPQTREDASLRDTYRCRRAVSFNGMVGYASSPLHLHSVLTGPQQSP